LSFLNDNGDRVMTKIILAVAFVLTATAAAFAQDYYAPSYYGLYNAVPGYYGAAPGYGYYDNYGSGPGWYSNDTERGGPGPRVGAGSGMGIGSQR
jgi:hypothetical protein